MTTPLEDFADVATDTVRVHKLATSQDFYRRSSFAPDPVSYAARIEQRVSLRRNADGDLVESPARAYVFSVDGETFPDIALVDRVVLPDDTSPPLLGIDRQRDEHGPHHLTLYFGAAGG